MGAAQMNVDWQWDTTWAVLPILLKGFETTLLATVIGSAVAIALGLIVSVIQQTGFKPVTWPLGFVFTFIRSTPVVVQLLAVYALLTNVPPLYIGIGVIGVHYATYQSEAFRAGIDAVPHHQ